MAIKPAGLVYVVGGGLLLFSGIKGATISDTVKAVLSGNLNVQGTETISFGSSGSGSGGNAPSSNAASGTDLQNGTTIYKYLRGAGYTPIQAAGATASIWGESTWNPEAVGTGGAGIMAWTPPSSMTKYGATCHAAGIGNNSTKQDFDSQLPAILRFVSANGDSGAVEMMKGANTVTQAAEIWGKKVERYGIDDVHTTGVDLATQIAKSVDNVTLVPA